MLNILTKSNRKFLTSKRFFCQPTTSNKSNNTQIHEENHGEPTRDLNDFNYPLFVPSTDVSQFLVDFNGLANNEVSEKQVFQNRNKYFYNFMIFLLAFY